MAALLRRIAGGLAVLITSVPLAAQPRSAPTGNQKWSVVPFVGCRSDGQTGPIAAPYGKDKRAAIPASIALRLAYYESEFGSGVLAPRGWHCFCTYGSNGSSLFVSSAEIGSKELFSDQWKGLTGPAIQISIMFGSTSGRFSVARTIARVFPAHSSFVRDVIAEGIEPASAFPFGPYAGDKLKYLSAEMVEYETPANSDGMGTASRLVKNADAISGVAILFSEDVNLLHLHIRVPRGSLDLVPFIISDTERAKPRE